MKYTAEQKERLKNGFVENNYKATEYKLDYDQFYLQRMIDDHYYKEPEEQFEIFESKINNQ